MNVFQVEQKRIRLYEELTGVSSVNLRVMLYFDFIEILLNSGPSAVSYFHEFLPPYFLQLSNFESFYKPPSFTEKLIEQLKKLKNYTTEKEKLNELIYRLECNLAALNDMLERPGGKLKEQIIRFPVLEKGPGNQLSFGFLESLTVEIKKSDHDQFLIIPSEQEIELNISEQVRISWNYALRYLGKFYRKAASHHKVIIHFDNRLGFYSGRSLGTALTLRFIEELFTFYNTDYIIRPNGCSVFSGSVDDEGKILPSIREIVRQKTDVVFFSDSLLFAVPSGDEKFASERVAELQQDFPYRKCAVIAVNSIPDVLNRRDLINISKKGVVRKTLTIAAKNKLTLLLTVVIFVLIFLSRLYDFDDNPAVLENHGKILTVLNKNGKILWQQDVEYNPAIPGHFSSMYLKQKLLDINNDGVNEVLLGKGIEPADEDAGNLICYDKNRNVIWKYKFRDSVEVEAEYVSPSYLISIIGIVIFRGEQYLVLAARHSQYATSTIFILDPATGRRKPGTLWHHGHLHSGQTGDFNGDGVPEVVVLGINNCLERTVMFSIDIDKINGRGPSKPEWEYKGYNLADFNKYILLPKSDYTSYAGLRFNSPRLLFYNPDTNEFNFYTDEDNSLLYTMGYTCSADLNEIRATVTDNFQVLRDSLVANGELSLPFTNTKEFTTQLLKQVKYLVDKK